MQKKECSRRDCTLICFPMSVLRLVHDAGVERQVVRAREQEKEGAVEDERDFIR